MLFVFAHRDYLNEPNERNNSNLTGIAVSIILILSYTYHSIINLGDHLNWLEGEDYKHV